MAMPVLTGLLTIASVLSLGQSLRNGRGPTWGPILIGVYGAGLVIAASLLPTPAQGFPPGTHKSRMPAAGNRQGDTSGRLVRVSWPKASLVQAEDGRPPTLPLQQHSRRVKTRRQMSTKAANTTPASLSRVSSSPRRKPPMCKRRTQQRRQLRFQQERCSLTRGIRQLEGIRCPR